MTKKNNRLLKPKSKQKGKGSLNESKKYSNKRKYTTPKGTGPRDKKD